MKSNENYRTTTENNSEIRVQPNDLLSIRLTSLNPESNALFNRGIIQSNGNALNADSGPTEGYLVDKDGFVNFPVLGKVMLGGLTKEEAINKMTNQIQQFVKSPIVTIQLLNFKITVIGEVNKPSTFIVPGQRINILEALGLAGDMTPYGKRENILLVREKDGVRSTTRLNLNDKELLNSPYFYLQQNDVVYIEPDRLKEVQASTNTRTITLATMAISIAVALIFNFQNIFK
ncbi:polysaccharide biosynthesis/export family protein [Hymenobacter coccineus]|uniref:polysaccharide biosynthesis/export family protein n=1 Tax=Hymenobacter coccineus TaxID=1908235 RepID=UPI001EFB836E|nr:polysaccharide biosynthesis/export family protein [Hymenobacter coccineus]